MFVSNLNLIPNPITLYPNLHGEPRKIICEELKKIPSPVVLIGLSFVGRRLITKDNALLLKGRRHRIFWGIKKNNKSYIRFGWHKLKNFNDQEAEHIKNSWHLEFFNNEGKYLIEKSGGAIHPHNFLYEKTQIKL